MKCQPRWNSTTFAVRPPAVTQTTLRSSPKARTYAAPMRLDALRVFLSPGLRSRRMEAACLVKPVAIWLSLCGAAFVVGAGFAAVGVVAVARWLAEGEDLPSM